MEPPAMTRPKPVIQISTRHGNFVQKTNREREERLSVLNFPSPFHSYNQELSLFMDTVVRFENNGNSSTPENIKNAGEFRVEPSQRGTNGSSDLDQRKVYYASRLNNQSIRKKSFHSSSVWTERRLNVENTAHVMDGVPSPSASDVHERNAGQFVRSNSVTANKTRYGNGNKYSMAVRKRLGPRGHCSKEVGKLESGILSFANHPLPADCIAPRADVHGPKQAFTWNGGPARDTLVTENESHGRNLARTPYLMSSEIRPRNEYVKMGDVSHPVIKKAWSSQSAWNHNFESDRLGEVRRGLVNLESQFAPPWHSISNRETINRDAFNWKGRAQTISTGTSEPFVCVVKNTLKYESDCYEQRDLSCRCTRTDSTVSFRHEAPRGVWDNETNKKLHLREERPSMGVPIMSASHVKERTPQFVTNTESILNSINNYMRKVRNERNATNGYVRSKLRKLCQFRLDQKKKTK